MVYKIQEITITEIRSLLGHIKMVHYFTDGCAGQYKNYKNFYNICQHQEEFQVSASITFFATSHGKSACDGIGGTVKRLARKASLQRPLHNQITDLDKLSAFCISSIPGISFHVITENNMKKLRQNHLRRYDNASTIKGTRSMHHFVAVSSSIIAGKRISSDKDYAIVWKFSSPVDTHSHGKKSE